MADEKTQEVQVRNRTKFIRGLHDAGGNYVELAPGAARTVALNEGEFNSAKSTGYFTFGEPGGSVEFAGDEADDLDVSVAELEAIAEREGVTLPTEGSGANGRVLKLDIQNAIVAARAAVNASGGTGTPPPSDDLDKMSDADLFDTVAALTGERPTDGTDRETLLRLARGEHG